MREIEARALFHTIEAKMGYPQQGLTNDAGGDDSVFSPSNGNSTLIIAEFLDGGDTKCGKKYWGDEGLTTTIASSGEMSEM